MPLWKKIALSAIPPLIAIPLAVVAIYFINKFLK